MKIKWIRPSGTEFESNDRKATIKYCESLGFKKVDKELKKDGLSEEMPVRKVASPPKEGSVKTLSIKKAVKKVKKTD